MSPEPGSPRIAELVADVHGTDIVVPPPVSTQSAPLPSLVNLHGAVGEVGEAHSPVHVRVEGGVPGARDGLVEMMVATLCISGSHQRAVEDGRLPSVALPVASKDGSSPTSNSVPAKMMAAINIF